RAVRHTASVARRVPPALEAVCLTALAANPADRYPSAAALASDVQHWLADEPVVAYPDPPAARLGRRARRHRPPATGASVLLLTGLLAAGVLQALIRVEQDRTAEDRLRTAMEHAAAMGRAGAALELQLYLNHIALAERTLAAHNPSRAIRLLDECPPRL